MSQSTLLSLPRTGHLRMDIHLSVDVNVTAVVAKRKVNAFLATHVGNLLLGSEPTLALTDRVVWRVPIELTSFPTGNLGRVGEVDVDVENGHLFLSEGQIASIKEQAERLITSSAS